MSYKPGDVVALKSASCAMTVLDIEGLSDDAKITVAWMYMGDIRIIKLPPTALVYNSGPGIAQAVDDTGEVFNG